VNHQSVELGVWLGLAMLALIGANLHLWRARRALSRLRHDVGMAEGGFVSSTRAEKTSSVTSP
jgi:hypothetical protein